MAFYLFYLEERLGFLNLKKKIKVLFFFNKTITLCCNGAHMQESFRRSSSLASTSNPASQMHRMLQKNARA